MPDQDPRDSKAGGAVGLQNNTPPQPKPELAQPWRAFFGNVTDGRVEPEWVDGAKPTGAIRLRHEYDDKHLGG